MIKFDVKTFMIDCEMYRFQIVDISARALCQRIGISPSFYCELVAGRREPGIQTAVKLCVECGLNLDHYIINKETKRGKTGKTSN